MYEDRFYDSVKFFNKSYLASIFKSIKEQKQLHQIDILVDHNIPQHLLYLHYELLEHWFLTWLLEDTSLNELLHKMHLLLLKMHSSHLYLSISDLINYQFRFHRSHDQLQLDWLLKIWLNLSFLYSWQKYNTQDKLLYMIWLLLKLLLRCLMDLQDLAQSYKIPLLSIINYNNRNIEIN